MSVLEQSYYKNLLLSIHRGWAKGHFSNAKPLYLLAIFEGISNGTILDNKLPYSKTLEELYIQICNKYEPNVKAALFYKPYYHSIREDYYFISWKGGTIPDHTWHTPSAKLLRENVEFAYLDNRLWNLLQDAKIREEFKQSIINHYLSPK